MTESEIISIAQDAQELIGKIDPAILKAATIGVATAIGKVAGEAGIKLLGSTGDNLLDGAGDLTKAAQDLLFRISQKYIANYYLCFFSFGSSFVFGCVFCPTFCGRFAQRCFIRDCFRSRI